MVEIHGDNWMIRRSAFNAMELLNVLCELSSIKRCGTLVLDLEHSTPDKTVFRFIRKRYTVK